jgi:hypothetical protein
VARTHSHLAYHLGFISNHTHMLDTTHDNSNQNGGDNAFQKCTSIITRTSQAGIAQLIAPPNLTDSFQRCKCCQGNLLKLTAVFICLTWCDTPAQCFDPFQATDRSATRYLRRSILVRTMSPKYFQHSSRSVTQRAVAAFDSGVDEMMTQAEQAVAIHMLDGVVYHLPTFRWLINDNVRIRTQTTHHSKL